MYSYDTGLQNVYEIAEAAKQLFYNYNVHMKHKCKYG